MKCNLMRLFRSFGYAWEGLVHAYKAERNIRIHIFIALFVGFLAFLLEVSSSEWLIIMILIGGVISLELINTAIERTIDLITNKEFHPLAKQAKDISAAAVFIFSLISGMIGLLIFSKKIIRLII